MLAFLTTGMVLLWVDKSEVVVVETTNGEKIEVEASRVEVVEEEKVTLDNESLKASISGLLSRIEQLEQTSGTTTITKTVTAPAVSFQPQIIYLGSASMKKHEWTDTGVEVVLNSADYPSSVSVVFQAGLSIEGGEAWARLYNKTTGSIMSITEVSHNTSTTTWKGSPTFFLHQGNNTYVVQMKSSSGETVNMSGARLIIGSN